MIATIIYKAMTPVRVLDRNHRIQSIYNSLDGDRTHRPTKENIYPIRHHSFVKMLNPTANDSDFKTGVISQLYFYNELKWVQMR